MNPYPEKITDEDSGTEVPNQEYIAYERGKWDERQRIFLILKNSQRCTPNLGILVYLKIDQWNDIQGIK